jgi:aminoglycoside phosphotransferase (APT) family kinase protein
MTAKNSEHIDKAVEVRKGEMPDLQKLSIYLGKHLPGASGELTISQFPGGYSNLTYLITIGGSEFVLRKPPFGVNIKSAHDMGREFRVLTALKPFYSSVPAPVHYCDNEDIIGSPFYLMERVRGIILRSRPLKDVDIGPETMRGISISAINNLAVLHDIDIDATGLLNLGKPDGYTARQVEGWVKRYFNAETDLIEEMNAAADWMQSNIPAEPSSSFIHNDYKYDNLVLDPEDLSHIIAVLDWEMATVGNPLMDLGTTLGYWAEPADHPALRPFNLTWLAGNLSREEVVQQYVSFRRIDFPDMLFYYIFGTFKIAVIVQQIFARYKKGFTSDERFSGLIHVVRACAENTKKAIHFKRISNFY